MNLKIEIEKTERYYETLKLECKCNKCQEIIKEPNHSRSLVGIRGGEKHISYLFECECGNEMIIFVEPKVRI